MRVGRHSPGIPQSVGPRFASRTGQRYERIVFRHRVGGPRRGMIDVDPQHLREQRREVLPDVVLIRIRSAVAGGDVQHPIEPKRDGRPIVPVRFPFDDRHRFTDHGIRRFAGNLIPLNAAMVRLVSDLAVAADIQPAIFFKSRMER